MMKKFLQKFLPIHEKLEEGVREEKEKNVFFDFRIISFFDEIFVFCNFVSRLIFIVFT